MKSKKFQVNDKNNSIYFNKYIHVSYNSKYKQNLKITNGNNMDFEKICINIICMEYINGVNASMIEQNPFFYQKLGKQIGNLSNVLKTFDHFAAYTDYIWDIKTTKLVLDNPLKMECIRQLDKNKYNLWKHYYDMHCNYLLPAIPKLRQSIIHGDLSDLNMIVNTVKNIKNKNTKNQNSNNFDNEDDDDYDELRLFKCGSDDYKACNDEYYHNDVNVNVNVDIAAFVDYGLCQYTCTMFEISVTVAYFMLRKHNPLLTLVEIVNSYNNQFKLESIEIDLIFVAAISRLLLSVTNAQYKIKQNPQNTKYYLVHSAPAWICLEKLKNQTPQTVANMIRRRIAMNQSNNNINNVNNNNNNKKDPDNKKGPLKTAKL